MKTLLEYITFIKGVEYLIIVAFGFGFIAFWLLVHNRQIEAKKIVSIAIPMSLIFGGAAVVLATSGGSESAANTTSQEPAFPEYYSNGSPATITSHNPDKWLNVNNSEYLAITYGPAVEFHQVMSNKISCKTCHHNSGDEIHACKDCHSTPFNPDNSSKPGLKAAYHQRCMFCHKEIFGGPESCTKCHTGGVPISAAVSAPARPHELTWETCTRCHSEGIPGGGQQMKIVYHDNCLKCHTKGIGGAAKVPDDHAGRASNTCQGCHKPKGG
ncbi:MAG: cytochrome c3 family protein [Candidatus Methanoperedens sp.]|nr:cytochrome c3 family protein [Candidatus Methanoperedens sp.]